MSIDTREYLIRRLTLSDFPQMEMQCRIGFPREHVTERIIHEKTFGSLDERDYSAGVFARNGSMLGFCWAAFWPSSASNQKAAIRLLAVSPAWRRRGVATSLLKETEKVFAAAGSRQLWLMACPGNYLTPGISADNLVGGHFAEANEYKAINVAHTCIETISRDEPIRDASWAIHGYSCRRAAKEDMAGLIRLVADHWPGVIPEIQRAYACVPAPLFIVLRGSEIVAFICYDTNNRVSGTVGPVVVAPKHRRLGICRSLFEIVTYELLKDGYLEAIYPWASPKVISLLEQAQARPKIRDYVIYGKELAR